MIFSLAFGTGLRLAELVGLNVSDVYFPEGKPRARVRIRPEIAKGGRQADVFHLDAVLAKLRRFWAVKRCSLEGTGPQAPLLCSQSRVRVSRRRVQSAWRLAQQRAGSPTYNTLTGFRVALERFLLDRDHGGG